MVRVVVYYYQRETVEWPLANLPPEWESIGGGTVEGNYNYAVEYEGPEEQLENAKSALSAYYQECIERGIVNDFTIC